jgi:hypothetical protein
MGVGPQLDSAAASAAATSGATAVHASLVITAAAVVPLARFERRRKQCFVGCCAACVAAMDEAAALNRSVVVIVNINLNLVHLFASPSFTLVYCCIGERAKSSIVGSPLRSKALVAAIEVQSSLLLLLRRRWFNSGADAEAAGGEGGRAESLEPNRFDIGRLRNKQASADEALPLLLLDRVAATLKQQRHCCWWPQQVFCRSMALRKHRRCCCCAACFAAAEAAAARKVESDAEAVAISHKIAATKNFCAENCAEMCGMCGNVRKCAEMCGIVRNRANVLSVENLVFCEVIWS